MSEDVTYSQLGPTSLNAGLGSEAVFENGEPEVNKKSVTAGLTVYYSLPKNRFLNYVRLFMAIQLCLIVSLYCAASAKDGWDSVDSVFPNSFSELTVDVVLLVLCEFIFTLVLHWRLESLTIRLANQPFDSHTRSRKTWLHLVDFAMATFVFGYSAVKAVFVWKDDWRHASYDRETEAWNNVSVSMLAIIIFCSFCHILISVALVWKLREIFTMVQNPKNVHFYNKRGVEVDENGRSLLLSRRTKSGSKLYRVAALAYPEWKLLTLGTLCLAAASTSSLLMPFYFGKIIDDSLDPDNDNLTDSIVILTVIACAGSIFAVVRGWAFNLAGYRLVSQMREDLFQAIVRQDIGFFDSSRVGELTSRLSSDTQVIQSSITVNISMVLRYTIQIVASVAVMFWLSAPLTGVLLAVVPLVAVGAAQYGRFYARKVKYFQDALGVANTTAEECISNVRTIRSFACDEKACEKYNQDISVSLSIGKTLSLIYGAFQGLVSLLIQCALVLVLWYGSKLVSDHSKNPKNGISIGDLSSFMMYSVGVAMAFAFLSSIFGDMMKAVGASTRLFQLVDRQPAIQETGVVRIPQSQLDARVDFDCVAFAYPIRPNKNVLQDISFSVQAGQTVALVGPSGGGKSTCINLLLHFYEPHSGTIKFGGVDIRELEWAWYHENVAVVSQEPVLFGYSVKDNIAFGKGASQEEVVEAAKLANAHEFISNLEHGYDTLVGEKGVRLSGGQKQRVAIARALIMNPRVLLLDEATSALDAESEAIVKDAIDRAMKNRTVLVIAHRLSTVKHADLVIVIENGTIAEKGSHEDLLEKNGIYKKLVINQLMTPNVEDNLENVLKVNDLALSSSSQTTAEVNDRITPFDEHVNATNSDKF